MKILKYEISHDEKRVRIVAPLHSEILVLQVQRGLPCLWLKGDLKLQKEERVFEWVADGNDVPEPMGKPVVYVGTVQDPNRHLFEI